MAISLVVRKLLPPIQPRPIPYGTYAFSSYWGSGYVVLPEGWENGYYWTVDALSNYALSDQCSAEDNTLIHSELAKMQQLCYDKAAEMKAALAENER